jgi:hypothetical protein
MGQFSVGGEIGRDSSFLVGLVFCCRTRSNRRFSVARTLDRSYRRSDCTTDHTRNVRFGDSYSHEARIVLGQDLPRTSPPATLLSIPLTAKAVRLGHLAGVAQWVRCARMLVVQEDGKLRSYGLSLRSHRLLKEVILHVLGQIAPYPNDSLAQGARLEVGSVDGI